MAAKQMVGEAFMVLMNLVKSHLSFLLQYKNTLITPLIFYRHRKNEMNKMKSLMIFIINEGDKP